MIWLITLGAIAAVGQLAFDVIEAIRMHREHKARLLDEQRLTADEARMTRDEKKIKHAARTKYRRSSQLLQR